MPRDLRLPEGPRGSSFFPFSADLAYVRFLRLGRQFVAAPTFSAKPLRGCHLVEQIAGKPRKLTFPTTKAQILAGGVPARAASKPIGRKLSITIAYWAATIRRAAQFRRRWAWASRDSSSRCSSRRLGWAATRRSGRRTSKAAVSPGSMAAIRRSTSVKYDHGFGTAKTCVFPRTKYNLRLSLSRTRASWKVLCLKPTCSFGQPLGPSRPWVHACGGSCGLSRY